MPPPLRHHNPMQPFSRRMSDSDPRLLAAGGFLCAFLCSAQPAPAPLAIANAGTRIAVLPSADGRAAGFRLLEGGTDRELARIGLGGIPGWTAEVHIPRSADSQELRFSAFAAPGLENAKLGPDTEIRVGLRRDDPYPYLTFRIHLEPDNGDSPKQEDERRNPPAFLTLRTEAAAVFYRGGFQTPLPNLDPYPIRSPSHRGKGEDGWTFSMPLRACPVPAAGLWAPERGVFLAWEFQAARSSDRSAKDISTACYAGGVPGRDRPILALMLPRHGVTTRTRLIYSARLGPLSSPNAFVLKHIWNTYNSRLPPAPATCDVGWLPKMERLAPAERTIGRLIKTPGDVSRPEIAAAFTPETRILGGGYRSVAALLRSADPERIEALRADWEKIKRAVVSRTLQGEECLTWRHPLTGDFRETRGGASAASLHSPSIWRLGGALLAMYEHDADDSLVPYIDGIYRWTKHSIFTRAGDPRRPAASTLLPADLCAVGFLLPFHRLFRSHPDEALRSRAGEALAVGRAVVYRCMAIYTDDPNETDALDPTFLTQADDSRFSFGTVSWDRADGLLRAMAVYYCETGDPILGYYLRGALSRWPLGYEADGLTRAEALVVADVGPYRMGQRLGSRTPSSDALTETFAPLAPAKLRILCGAKQAVAFSAESSLRIEDFRPDGQGWGTFRVEGEERGTFHIRIASPCRSPAGQTVEIDGEPAAAEQIDYRGEDLILRGIRAGTTIRIGRVPNRAQAAGRQDATGRKRVPHERNGFRLLPLPASKAVDTSWRNGRSWAGLTDGLHFAWGVPFHIDNRRQQVIELSDKPVSIVLPEPSASVFLFLDASPGEAEVILRRGNGAETLHRLTRAYPALAPGPMRDWRIRMYRMELSGAAKESGAELGIRGTGLLFALTTHPDRAPPAVGLLADLDTARDREKEARESRASRNTRKQLRMAALRRETAEAARGKTLRIALIPPHESYTEMLAESCAVLGVPPAMLSPEELIDPDRFSPALYPIAVYSAPETFLHTVKRPGDAARAVRRFLAAGGTLVVAGRGYPFYYALRTGKKDAFERVEGLRNSQTCTDLEIPIRMGAVPPLKELPNCRLVPGQEMFELLPATSVINRVVGGGYRLATGDGLPPEDTFAPIAVLGDMTGKDHGAIAAWILHGCPRYRGGRTAFLWGNILNQDNGPEIALEFLARVIRTTPLQPTPELRPRLGILPQDCAGHDQAIERACAAIGLKPYRLTPAEFADPAVFNPVNFPLAIHAPQKEYFIDRYGARGQLWRRYVDYVRGGGFLLAAGNMWQFYYSAAVDGEGRREQTRDTKERVRQALGITVSGGRFRDGRPMFLETTAGQDIVTAGAPIPLDYLSWGVYRAIDGDGLFETEVVPLARVVDPDGNPFGDSVIALLRLTGRAAPGAEMLWFWGNLLDDERAYPLFEQALRYAYGRRKERFDPPE